MAVAGERVTRLEAELALAATAPPVPLQGDLVELLPDAVAHVPTDALAVVTTTWTLSQFLLERRLRFLHRLRIIDSIDRRLMIVLGVAGQAFEHYPNRGNTRVL
jgi:hypothetical protein